MALYEIKMKQATQSALYGVLGAAINTALSLLIKISAEAPQELIVFSRFTFGLPIALWMAHSQGVRFSFNDLKLNLTRSLLGIAAVYLYVYAISLLPLVNAMTLASTAPLFMPFLVLIRSKKLVSGLRFFATAIGFLGVVLLMRPEKIALEVGSICAILVGLLSAYTGLERRLLSKGSAVSSEKMVLYYFSFGSLASLYPMIFTWNHSLPLSLWVDLVAMGICSVIGQYLFTKVYAIAPATKASIFSYLNILFGGVVGWLILEEVPSMAVWSGACLIIFGALLAIFDHKKARPLSSFKKK